MHDTLKPCTRILTPPTSPGWWGRTARRAVLDRLKSFGKGGITIIEGQRRIDCGAGEPRVRVTVHDPRLVPPIAAGGQSGGRGGVHGRSLDHERPRGPAPRFPS